MDQLMTIDPKDISVPALHGLMQGVVAPRPIAFASTVDKDGKVNLSPFSFFNMFSSNPPVLIFSPSRRVRDNSTKHTLDNVHEHGEVVINIVNYAMVQQMSLSSTEYEKGVNEFIKAGFTEVPSEKVKPPRVAESPAAFECKVKQIVPLGDQGGAGNLVICEVLLMHFKKEILDEQGRVDTEKVDTVARMGGNWYCRAHSEALFEVPKPLEKKGMGVDELPERIRLSSVLTGNDLGMLGNVDHLPSDAEVREYHKHEKVQLLVAEYENDPTGFEEALHQLAQQYLHDGYVEIAWKILLQM
jgi:flavin reductase (DIM6/NTAB) family NADH-FMN oxidoreductase RutF